MTLGAVALAEAPLAGDAVAETRTVNATQTAPAATQSAANDDVRALCDALLGNLSQGRVTGRPT